MEAKLAQVLSSFKNRYFDWQTPSELISEFQNRSKEAGIENPEFLTLQLLEYLAYQFHKTVKGCFSAIEIESVEPQIMRCRAAIVFASVEKATECLLNAYQNLYRCLKKSEKEARELASRSLTFEIIDFLEGLQSGRVRFPLWEELV